MIGLPLGARCGDFTPGPRRFAPGAYLTLVGESIMRISESTIRRIIREEIVREQATAVLAGDYLMGKYKEYTGEKSAQGLSVPQKVAYAGARQFLDAVPAGAREVATGGVPFKAVTYWNLNPAQKQVITDGLETISTYTGALSIAFPPVTVVPVATGIVSAALKASDGDLTGSAKDLLGSILVGALATGKLSELLTRKLGAPLAQAIGKDPRKFLRGVTGDGTSLMPELRQALAKLGGATNVQAALAAGYKGSVMARGAGVLLKEVVNAIFEKIDGAIASLLVAMSTKSGRVDLSKQYAALKAQALALLENPAGNSTLLAALEKAGQILPAAT